MSRPRVGSMFSGVGGLDLAITEALDAETVFVADVCKVNKDGSVGHHYPCRAPCSILAHRFPGVPNLGDVSAIKWVPDCPILVGGCGRPATVQRDLSGWECHHCQMLWPIAFGKVYWPDIPPPVEIICAGFPCQDVSVAGNRAGLKDGTRTGLWSQVVRAITELQPRLVVLENVPGIFTASAAGDVEPCPVCLGDGSGEHLRALDAVLADLAAIGFDADWTVVPASGVGAAHKRERWFCTAYPSGQPWSFEYGDGGVAADAGSGQLARIAV